MSKEALLPCFVCGTVLENVLPDGENQPFAGTEFRTEGHYGSTFWDSFDGEELVLNICDACLRAGTERLAQHKRYLPLRCEGLIVGRQSVERPMVRYSGNADTTEGVVDSDELGTAIPGVEWLN